MNKRSDAPTAEMREKIKERTDRFAEIYKGAEELIRSFRHPLYRGIKLLFPFVQDVSHLIKILKDYYSSHAREYTLDSETMSSLYLIYNFTYLRSTMMNFRNLLQKIIKDDFARSTCDDTTKRYISFIIEFSATAQKHLCDINMAVEYFRSGPVFTDLTSTNDGEMFDDFLNNFCTPFSTYEEYLYDKINREDLKTIVSHVVPTHPSQIEEEESYGHELDPDTDAEESNTVHRSFHIFTCFGEDNEHPILKMIEHYRVTVGYVRKLLKADVEKMMENETYEDNISELTSKLKNDRYMLKTLETAAKKAGLQS
jgi:hypothetical protein